MDVISTDSQHREREAARNRAVQRVLLVTLGLNVLVAAAKGVYGIWSGTLVIAADAIHSLVDGSANIVGMVALRLAAAPPDPKHPYGHRKIEIAAAAALGIAIGFTALQLGWSAIQSLRHGSANPDTSVAGFAVIGGTWLVNLFVAAYEYRRARQLRSAYLEADAVHTASDLAVTAAVLASFTATYYGVTWTDPVGALVVVVVIARVAWGVLTRNLSILLDRVMLDPQAVHDVAMSIPGVRDCHRIRSRGTAQAVHLDLHLQLDGAMPLDQAHALAHRVEDALRQAMPAIVDVTIHIEPQGDPHEAP